MHRLQGFKETGGILTVFVTNTISLFVSIETLNSLNNYLQTLTITLQLLIGIFSMLLIFRRKQKIEMENKILENNLNHPENGKERNKEKGAHL